MGMRDLLLTGREFVGFCGETGSGSDFGTVFSGVGLVALVDLRAFEGSTGMREGRVMSPTTNALILCCERWYNGIDVRRYLSDGS